MQRPRTVMLRDKIDYPLRQSHFFSEFYAVRYVTDDDLGTLRRFETVVWIFTQLILDKVFRGRRFPDVVVQRTDSRQQAIAPNNPTRFLSQLTDRV